MATPAIRSLRRRFPEARIVALARPTGADVLEHNPNIDLIVAADRLGKGTHSENVVGLVRMLRRQSFDLAVVLPNSLRTGLLAWRCRARRRIGYAGQWRSPFLTDPIPQPRENGEIVPVNMVDRYLVLCGQIGCTELSKKEELFAAPEDIAQADQLLERAGVGSSDRLAVLIPGAAYGPAKLWGAEKYAAVADALVEKYHCKVLAHVGPGEEEIGQQVAAAARRGVLVLPGIDLKMLKGVIRRSFVVIGNDTGPRHYAVAYDVPNVAILGPTSRRYIDVNLEETRILQAEVDCGPCQRKVCSLDHKCMTRITPDQVLTAVASLLD